MSKAEELLREVQALLKQPGTAAPQTEEGAPRAPSGDRVVEPEAQAPPVIVPPEIVPRRAERHRQPVKRGRVRKKRPVGPRRTGKVLVSLAAIAMLAAAALGAVYFLSRRDALQKPGEAGAGALPEQQVVAWTVWEERPARTFISVLAAAEGLEPVLLGVPTHTVVDIPGQGPGTLGEAAARGDADLVGTMVSGLLHVEVDATMATSFEELAVLIDRIGGVAVDGTRMRGPDVVAYLSQRPVDAELRFLRWQEVSRALMPALSARPGVLRSAIPRGARDVVGVVGGAAPAPLELPVRDVGSGLARPMREDIERLVEEWFVPTARTAAPVDLVVLNGNGIPGIGERVAARLVPAGFRLVSSQNAPTFDVRVTQIVATDPSFLDEAELARKLLGVGRVALDPQTTAVAEVAIVVGKDFGGRDG